MPHFSRSLREVGSSGCANSAHLAKDARYGAPRSLGVSELAAEITCWQLLAPYFDPRDGPSHDCGDLADLRHQFVELVGEEGLRAVGQGFVRLVMDFHHQAVGADGYGGARERSDFVALAGAVAGVDENRQDG